MSDPHRPRLPTDRRPPPFRPRFTISILYMLIFFLLFCFLQVLPQMIDLIGATGMTPEQQEAAAQEIMRERVSLLLSLLLSLGATGLGAYYEVLPGLTAR